MDYDYRDLTQEHYYQHEFHQRRLMRLAASVRDLDVVLDVGCNGAMLARVLPSGCSYYGIDRSRQAIERAAACGYMVTVAAAEHLPFPSKFVDVVVMGQLLERVADVDQSLREAARVSRRLLVGDTTDARGIWGDFKGERAFHASELHALLSKVGKVQYIEPIRWDATRYATLYFEVKV